MATLITQLQNHIAVMAPHQKERHAGQLLIHATKALSDRETGRRDLLEAIAGLLEQYDDRKAQWGDEYLWKKHENPEPIKKARELLSKYKP